MSSIANYTIAIIVYDTKNLTYQKQKKTWIWLIWYKVEKLKNNTENIKIKLASLLMDLKISWGQGNETTYIATY